MQNRSRRIASCSPSWYRWAWLRSSSAPGGGRQRIQHRRHDRGALRRQATRTAPPRPRTSSPACTDRSSNALVLHPGPGPRAGTGRGPACGARPDHAGPSRTGPRRPRIVVRGLPAVLRQLAGPAADRPGVYSDTSPAASACASRGCAAARRTHAVYATAAPLDVLTELTPGP